MSHSGKVWLCSALRSVCHCCPILSRLPQVWTDQEIREDHRSPEFCNNNFSYTKLAQRSEIIWCTCAFDARDLWSPCLHIAEENNILLLLVSKNWRKDNDYQLFLSDCSFRQNINDLNQLTEHWYRWGPTVWEPGSRLDPWGGSKGLWRAGVWRKVLEGYRRFLAFLFYNEYAIVAAEVDIQPESQRSGR